MKAAVKYLEGHGWTTGRFVDGHGSQVCAVGAIILSTVEHLPPEDRREEYCQQFYLYADDEPETRAALVRAAYVVGVGTSDVEEAIEAIASWNDKQTSEEPVLDLLASL
jgi:hypothetical protein